MAKIGFYNQQKKFPIPKKLFTKQVNFLLKYFHIKTDQIDLIFVTKGIIQKLHKQFFQDDSPTDVITLPLDPIKNSPAGFHHLGEIVICPFIAMEEAKKRNITLKSELSLYLVHGFLHLVGYDDQKEKEKKSMRKKEKFFMNHFKEKFFL